MADWLTREFTSANELPPANMALRLGIALLCGMFVAGVYLATQRRDRQSTVILTTTLLLLTILVAMTTVVIGENLARAFGLVGALSIVRFRTIVEDTRDTVFVIFAVVVGMALGGGHYLLCLIGIPLVAAAAAGCRCWGGSHTRGGVARVLELRVGIGGDPAAAVAAALREVALEAQLSAVTTARQGAALDLRYRLLLKQADDALPVAKRLQNVEGVQQVELKEP